jgi:hypothetical protein
MTNKDRILELYPGAIEMPDASGTPSADYCIVRPATKEDWPENKWVAISTYVSGDPWDAAWKQLNPTKDEDRIVLLDKIEGVFSAYMYSGDIYNQVLHMESDMLRAKRDLLAEKEKVWELEGMIANALL